MAMKAFLKERIYGRIQNFNKNNITNKNHLTFRYHIINNEQNNISNHTSLQSYNKHKKTIKHSKIFSISTKFNDKSTKISKIHQLTQQNINQMKRKQYIKKSQMKILNKNKNKYNQCKTQRYHQSKMENQVMTSRYQKDYHRYVDQGISFISAVDIQHIDKNALKLPQISSRNMYKVEKQKEKAKNNTIISKIDTKISLTLDDQLWTYLCNKNIAKQLKKSNTKINELSNSIASINTEKISIKQLDPKINNKNTNSLLKNSLLDKQKFSLFTKNIQFNIPQFFATISSFFELGTKIQDKMKRIDFDNILNSLFMMNKRAWAVVIFRYLDQNHDGKIDSSDLFKIYNYLDEILSKNQQFIRAKQQNIHSDAIKQSESNNQTYQQPNNSNKKNQNRQKTQISQKSSISKTLNTNKKASQPKRSRKVSLSSSLNSYPQTSSEQLRQSMFYMKHNIENIKTLKKQIQKINIIILQIWKSTKKLDDYDENNPEKQFQPNTTQKKDNKIIYLQQMLLKKQQLKFTDMNLILSLTQKQSKKNQNVIDIDKKKLNIKLSSMYVQTFSATDHNEQTRINRQYIENLKQSLKKKNQLNQQSMNGLEKKILPQIQYERFLEQELYLPFKQIFLSSLHLQGNENEKLS